MPVPAHRALMKQRLLERSLTQGQAADQIRISRWTMHRIANGHSGSRTTRRLVAEFFGDPVPDLFPEIFDENDGPLAATG